MLRMGSEVGTYSIELKQGDETKKQQIEVTELTATLTVPETVGGAEEFKVE